MPCTKTGCHIFVAQHGLYAYGDAFEVEVEVPVSGGFEIGKIAYFRLVTTSFKPIDNNPVLHYTVHDYDNWFDEATRMSTLISADFTNHGYEGKFISKVQTND